MMRGIGSGWQQYPPDPEQESWVEIGFGLCGVLFAAAVIMIVLAFVAGCGVPCRPICNPQCHMDCTVRF